VGNNADSHELLSVVAAVHHERVGETLHDGAVGLAEALLGIPTSGVRNVDRSPNLDVVARIKRRWLAMLLPFSKMMRQYASSQQINQK
jgi:hypothetical protein